MFIVRVVIGPAASSRLVSLPLQIRSYKSLVSQTAVSYPPWGRADGRVAGHALPVVPDQILGHL